MNNYLKNSKNIEFLTLISVYLLFILIGLFSYKDYGLSIDEWALRIHGFVNLKYIMLTLFNFSPVELDQILEIPELNSFYGTHGAYFAVFISLIEYIFKIHDIKNNHQNWFYL